MNAYLIYYEFYTDGIDYTERELCATEPEDIVFANSSKEAKEKYFNYDSILQDWKLSFHRLYPYRIKARRIKKFDEYANLAPMEIAEKGILELYLVVTFKSNEMPYNIEIDKKSFDKPVFEKYWAEQEHNNTYNKAYEIYYVPDDCISDNFIELEVVYAENKDKALKALIDGKGRINNIPVSSDTIEGKYYKITRKPELDQFYPFKNTLPLCAYLVENGYTSMEVNGINFYMGNYSDYFFEKAWYKEIEPTLDYFD